MTFCKRCGELCPSEKCKKCGGTNLVSNSLFRASSVVDRWQARYLGGIIGEDTPSTFSKSIQPSPLKKRISTNQIPGTSRYPSNVSVKSRSTTSCHACKKELSGKTVRLPESQVKYHWACLICKHCELPFEMTSFYIDGAKDIYHPECASASTIQSCSRCSLAITDTFLAVQTSRLHLRCFRCTSCQKVLHPSTIYAETNGAFCKQCSPTETTEQNFKIVPLPQAVAHNLDVLAAGSAASSTCSSPVSPHCPSPAARGPIRPSSLMSSRGRPLPRFGAIKMCAGCDERIESVHEEKVGPRATRWHPKCLACVQCAKALDSSAMVHDLKGRLQPWCTTCLLVSKKHPGPPRRNASNKVTPVP